MPVLELTAEERRELSGFVASRSLPHALVARAQLVLWAAEGVANAAIGEHLNWSKPTVGKWRQRFVEHRLEGLYEELRPRPPALSLRRAGRRSAAPHPQAETARSNPLERSAGSRGERAFQVQVHRVFQLFSLQPRRSKSCKLSTDPFFVEKVRDVVGLYLNPPHHAVVLSVDEKGRTGVEIQALKRTRPVLPMGPGYVAGVTHDDVRHGTTTLFAALDIATGRVLTECKPRHRHQEFLGFLQRIDQAVPEALARRASDRRQLLHP